MGLEGGDFRCPLCVLTEVCMFKRITPDKLPSQLCNYPQNPMPIPWLTSSELTKVKAKRGQGLAKKETFSVPCSLCLCHEGALRWLSGGARAEDNDPC